MSDKGRMAARVVPGPGRIGRPEAVARSLDRRLQELVGGLEAVANCPELALDLPQDLDPAARLARFCDALAGVGRPLMRELAGAYRDACAEQRLSAAGYGGLLDERAAALVSYFAELTRVHGVAFATDGAPPPAATVERALAALERDLLAALDDAAGVRG